MSFQTLVDYMYDKLTLNDSSGAIIHSVFFIIFANWAMQRYAWNFIEHLGVNVRPWLRKTATILLHLNVLVFWVILLNLFRALKDITEAIIPTPEGKYTIYILMNFLYFVIAYLPLTYLIYDITLESIMESLILRMELRYPMPVELGQEELLARTSNLELPKVNHPPAYRLKKSTSAYMYRNIIKPELYKCKSTLALDKISKLEDIINN